MGMPELVWWRAFLGIGTLRSNTIPIKRNVNIRTGYVTQEVRATMILHVCCKSISLRGRFKVVGSTLLAVVHKSTFVLHVCTNDATPLLALRLDR